MPNQIQNAPSPQRIFEMFNAFQQKSALKAAIDLKMLTAVGRSEHMVDGARPRPHRLGAGCHATVRHHARDRSGRVAEDKPHDARKLVIKAARA